MRKRLLAAAAACCLLLGGCVFHTASTGSDGAAVYRIQTGGEESGFVLTAEYLPIAQGETELTVIVRGLNSPSGSQGLKRAFPEGVEIHGCTVEKGRAQVTVSESYGELEGTDRVLANYAIAYSLLRLDQVLAVDIWQGTQLVEYGLTADGAVLADTGHTPCQRIVKLFVPDFEQAGLVSQTALLTTDGSAEIWELAARELLSVLDSLPEATSLRSIQCEDGLCTVNLSQEIYTTEPEHGYAAKLILGAFVNTLCYLPEVEQVTIQVGGTPIASYGSYIPDWPMRYDASLLCYPA